MERKCVKADVGVVVGRFQVDELHAGHRELLDWVEQQHKKVLVVLGCPATRGTRNNPLDFESREQMIREQYPWFLCLPLNDTLYDDEWSRNLDKLIGSVVSPSQSVVLYGSRKSFLDYYRGSYRTQELVGDQQIWSGTEVREAIKGHVKPTKDFRRGAIWQAYNAWPRVIPTVDVAVVKPNDESILLARKEGEPLWRFIGGFADPRSGAYEEDAAREVEEETGVDIVNIQYVCSVGIDDWRYRGEVDKIRTTLFMATYAGGEPKAADDIKECRWFSIPELTEADIMPAHRILYKCFIKFYEG